MSIEVIGYCGTTIEAEFAGKNLWRLSAPCECKIRTNEGVLGYFMKKGFPTDMRSGSAIINPIIPKFTGNNQYNLAILVHDFNYTANKQGEHYVSRLLADQLLREMARHSKTLNAVQRALMYRALRIGGGSAYEEMGTGAYENAWEFMAFEWEAK